MSHIPTTAIHAIADRGLDVQVAVTTTTDSGDFTAITFRVGTIIEVESLTADATATGFTVDVELTDELLTVDAGRHTWELVATVDGEVRTLAYGPFLISEAPTS